MLKIGFIGTGNMATAIIAGVSTSMVGLVDLKVWDKDKAKMANIAEQYAAEARTKIADVCDVDILILAVKPNHTEGVLEEIAPFIKPDQCVISVAAGVPLATYEAILPNAKVVRAMPNTSSAVLKGMTGLMTNARITSNKKRDIELIFDAIGKVIWIKESDIHALIAVSGSGPAYFYYFCEQMALAGEKLGLSPEVAEILARETLVGAGKMLNRGGSPAELRRKVTSPNGTTEQAILAFEKAMPAIVESGMEACARKSQEMEEQFTR